MRIAGLLAVIVVLSCLCVPKIGFGAARAQAESAVGRAVLSGSHNRGETWHFDGPSETLNHSRLEPQ